MLTRESIFKPDTYKFVNGMLNVAWITGFARNVEPNKFLIQQVNNLNHSIPVMIATKDFKPSYLRETYPVKVLAHLHGTQIQLPNGTLANVVGVRAIGIQRPSVLDMPAQMAWEKTVPKGAPVDETFKPNTGNNERLGLAANTTMLAGFVENVVIDKKIVEYKGEQVVVQRLIVLLRQSPDPTKCIELRYYGKYFRQYYKDCMEAMRNRVPIMASGSVRVNVKEVGEPKEGELTPVLRMPYVHVESIHPCTPDEVKVVPNWVSELGSISFGGVPKTTVAASSEPDEAALPQEALSAVTADVNGPVRVAPAPAINGGNDPGVSLSQL